MVIVSAAIPSSLCATLPLCFLCRCRQQIVQFILQNTAGAVQAPIDPQFVDPFTGAGAYVPTSTSGFGSGGGSGGGSATGGNVDPFTGSGGSAIRHLPAKEYLVFDQVGGGILGVWGSIGIWWHHPANVTHH